MMSFDVRCSICSYQSLIKVLLGKVLLQYKLETRIARNLPKHTLHIQKSIVVVQILVAINSLLDVKKTSVSLASKAFSTVGQGVEKVN